MSHSRFSPDRGHHKPKELHKDHSKWLQHYKEANTTEKLIINLRGISHMMHRQFEGNASQKRILIHLNESGTTTQKELTEWMDIKPGSASELLTKLENAGLITRIQNESDKRTANIQLTEAGSELAERAVENRDQQYAEMFTCLSEDEQETLLSLLEKIHNDWGSDFEWHKEHVNHKAKSHGRHSRHDE